MFLGSIDAKPARICSDFFATSGAANTPDQTLAAFFATALISVQAVFFAYLSNALDDDSVTYLDRRVIELVRRCWYAMRPGRRPSDEDMEQARELRKEGVVDFILSLSDQQLMTGLAILIAGVANANNLTRYEFIAIHSLAWFSSTTHLATLDCLRDYFKTHKLFCAVRTFGILCFLVMLTYCIIIRALLAMSGGGPGYPVECVFDHFHPHPRGTNWYGTFNILWQCSWLFVLLLVIIGYLIRIQDFYANQRHPFYLIWGVKWKLTHLGQKASSFARTYEERKAAYRLMRLNAMIERKGFWRLMPYDYDGSFLSSIPSVIFSFSYAVSQVAAVRWGMDVRFPSRATIWGYGQIVSILLLCMPFIAAGEMMQKYRKKHSHHLEDYKKRLSEASTLRSMSMGLSIDSATLEKLGKLPSHLDSVKEQYEEQLSGIKRYFCKDVRCLRETRLGHDSTEATRQKQYILAKYEVVRQFEQQIDITPAIVWFLVNVTGAVVLGVLLNAANFDNAGEGAQTRISFAIALLFTFIACKVVSLCYEISAIIRTES